MSETQMDQSLPATKPAGSRGPTLTQIVVVVAILAVGVGITAMTAKVTQMAEPGIRLMDGKPVLAEQAGEWKGGPMEGLSEAERKILPPDTLGARRIYADTEGHEIFCSVVLEGSDVTSIHRPELCLTGQGWVLGDLRTESIAAPAAPSGALPVSWLSGTRDIPMPDGRIGRSKALFLYWFVGKDRVTASHPQRIMLTTLDRVFRNRNARWAYFLILVPVGGEKAMPTEDEAMKLVTKFLQDLYPTLVTNS